MTELSPVTDRNRQAPPGVRLDLVGAVARICFDRPPVNAFTVEEFRRFRAYLKQVGDDPRPVLLTGANGMFSAGFDIRQPGLDDAATVDAARDCLAAIQDHPAPVVAAVEGAAVGIGLLIALSADILVISRSARLRMPEILLGIDSDVAPLRRFLPDPWIRRMCLSGEAFTATDMRLDYCAGATVCEPGTSEQAAAAVFESFSRIDPLFLARAKRRLTDLLSTLSLTKVEVSHKVDSCSITTALI
jgi:enoyl-CoA hydratase